MEFENVDLADWEVARTAAGAHLEPSTLPMDLDWVSAPVPGTVADAWRAAGRWQADSTFDFDADDWWFRCTFSASPGARRLRFGGIATIADGWLNDSHILHTDNMFHRHELDVDVAAHNELIVVCRSVKDLLTKRRPRPQWRTKLVESQNLRWIRTSFLGRIPSMQPQCAAVGMWRPVTLGEPTAVVVDSILPRLIDDVATVSVRLLGRASDISQS
ncbi:MAG: beta-mannosidase, partial [Ilumatobacteraceae bacterium]